MLAEKLSAWSMRPAGGVGRRRNVGHDPKHALGLMQARGRDHAAVTPAMTGGAFPPSDSCETFGLEERDGVARQDVTCHWPTAPERRRKR